MRAEIRYATAATSLAAATVLTAAAAIASQFSATDAAPAVLALAAGLLHLAVSLLFPRPTRCRVVAARRVGPAPTGTSRAVGRAAVLVGAPATT